MLLLIQGSDKMKSVYKKIDITPNQPTLMSGYLGKRMSTNTKDKLYARILRVDNHIFISCDLIGVDYAITQELRNKFPNLTIDIFANHTHAGPVGTIHTDKNLLFMNDVFQNYSEAYSLSIIETLTQAINTMQPQETTAGYVKDIITQVSGNRHDLKLPFDNEVTIITLVTSMQKIAIIRLALHPTYLKEDNTLYSNDILGPIEKDLSEQFDGILFIQGALGDVSTRYTRQDYSMEELASKLSKELLTISNKEIIPITNFSRKTIVKSTVDRFKKDLTFESTLFNINDLSFLGLPFEVCSPLNTILKNQHNTTILSLCNGYLAYLSPSHYYTQNEYESEMTLFDKGEAENLIKEIMHEIK